MNSQSPSSVLEWIVAEDFFSLKVNRRRLLRATAVVTISEAALSLAYLVYIGAVSFSLSFPGGEFSSFGDVLVILGFLLSGIVLLAIALRSTPSSQSYWKRFRGYTIALVVGGGAFLFTGSACEPLLGGFFYWYRDVLIDVFSRLHFSGLSWLDHSLEMMLNYVLAGALVYLGMVTGIFVVWRARRQAEKPSRQFWLRNWRPRLVPDLTRVPKACVNGPGSSEGKNQRDS
jgi:hypothetical protein